MEATARYCIAVVCLCFIQLVPVLAAEEQQGCETHIAQWLNPAGNEPTPVEQVFQRLQRSRIVLLGESHTAAEHHRWQHDMLAALHSRNANLIVGFEMLPRSAQRTLEAWSAGTLTEKAFLEQTNWQEVWGYDAALYMPLFHFVRRHRISAVALNIDRQLILRTGQVGWKALSEGERAGLSTPAPASSEYRQSLARLYAYKWNHEDVTATEDVTESELDEILNSDQFANFVDAQLLWDSAMAEALAAAYHASPDAMVVGIVGRGHLEYGYGIPHQLTAMGISDVEVLLPLDSTDTCDPLPEKLADFVFVVEAESGESSSFKPRLGVLIEGTDAGVRVLEIDENGVAAQSGIIVGDLIQSAAGLKITTSDSLVEIIERQAPGTLLPLKIMRGGEQIELLAKFPQWLQTEPESPLEED